MTQILYDRATRRVLGGPGAYPPPPAGASTGVMEIGDGEAAKFAQRGGGWAVSEAGTITVLPAPPLPATRPKNMPEWRALFLPLRAQYNSADTAFRAVLPNVPAGATKQAITQLGLATAAVHDAVEILARAMLLEPDPADDVPNTGGS